MYMYNTLGMSGIWSKNKERNPVLEIIYSSRKNITQNERIQSLYFMDQRHFATIKFVTTKKELQDKLKTIGPDMLNDPDMSYEKFAKIIKKQKTKNWGFDLEPLQEIAQQCTFDSDLGKKRAESLPFLPPLDTKFNFNY